MSAIISIISPVKNVSPWILETATSILSQTFTDWEWIIVDDHSTDDTFEKIQLLAQSDYRISIFKNDKHGIIPALQLAVSRAKGKYLTRMDGDDLMPEQRLALFFTLAESHSEKTVVTGKVNYFSASIVSEGYLKYESWLNEIATENSYYNHIYRECVVASPNWLMHRQTALDIQLFVLLDYPEDYDMCFRWKSAGLSIVSVDEVTLLWREHPLRTSRTSEIYQQEKFFELKLKWMLHFYPNLSIGVLGYGTKGKLAARILNENKKKITVYTQDTRTLVDTPLKQFKKADLIQVDLLLIAIFPPQLSVLEAALTAQNFTIGKNAFYL